MTSNITDFPTDDEASLALAETLQVIEMPDGFHVVQIPGQSGAVLTHWTGPQANRAAAEMQLGITMSTSEPVLSWHSCHLKSNAPLPMERFRRTSPCSTW